MPEIKSWHRAIVIYFAIAGLTMSSFMVRLPLVRELLAVNIQELGLLLLAFSVGSMSSLTFIGKTIARFGTRPVIISGFVTTAISTFVQIVFVTNGIAIGFVVAAFVTGFAMGAADVAINVDGAAIEKRLGKSTLPRMHASFSIGTLAGALIGTISAAIEFSFFWQIAILSTINLVVALIFSKMLPTSIGKEEVAPATEGDTPSKRIINPTLILLSLGILCMTVAEGAANDWITLAVVDDYKDSATNAGIAFALVMAAMTLTRYFGGIFVDRFGKSRTLRVLIAIGLTGVLLMIFGQSIWFAWIGAAFWGIGVSLGFPLFISAAAEQEHGARKVAFVTTFGYFAFLVGPPLLGLVGQQLGLLNMFYLIAAFLVIAWFASGATGRQKLHEKLSSK